MTTASPRDGRQVHDAAVRVASEKRNGGLTVHVDAGTEGRINPGLTPTSGRLTFRRTEDGAELLAEQPAHFWWPGPRLATATGNGYHRLEQRFRAYPGERLYGLGQHTHGLLDQKGAVIDLVQRNAEVSIPFLLSSRGYGLLWNSPAVGRVELAETGTRWVADSARQIDYWITAGRPADVLRRYADATGRRVSIEYALIRDINDQPERAQLLAELLRGRLAHVNLIPLNPTPGSPWTASRRESEQAFVRILRRAGVSTTVRDTRGREIDAACGQLAALQAAPVDH